MKGERVLVLDSQGQNSLALSRLLGRKGVSVTAGAYRRFMPGMLSKYTDGAYVHPNPAADQRAFVDHLYRHLEANDYAAVFTTTDLGTTLLSRYKARLEETGTAVGAEDWDRFQTANDKGHLFELAADLDVPCPETHAPTSVDEVAALDEDRTYTAVVKPRRTTVLDEDGTCLTSRISGSNYVSPDEDLVERYRAIRDASPAFETIPPLVQAFVDGLETKCTVGLADEGELLAFFQHKKYRVYPLSGGVGAVRQGTWEPRMLDYTRRVVEALEWTGPVMVEFMETADGDFVLLEVNGRYWGSLALTINSGVEIPWLHYHQLIGAPLAPRAPGYRTDVKQRKLFYQDLLWLRAKLERGEYGALLPFLGSFFTTREELLDPSDPLPSLGIVPRTVQTVVDARNGRSVYDQA